MQLGCKQSRQCLAEYRRKILIRFIQKVPEIIVTFGFLTPQTGYFWNVANIYHNLQQIYTFSPRYMYTNFNLGSQIAHIIYIAIFCVIEKSLKLVFCPLVVIACYCPFSLTLWSFRAHFWIAQMFWFMYLPKHFTLCWDW